MGGYRFQAPLPEAPVGLSLQGTPVLVRSRYIHGVQHPINLDETGGRVFLTKPGTGADSSLPGRPRTPLSVSRIIVFRASLPGTRLSTPPETATIPGTWASRDLYMAGGARRDQGRHHQQSRGGSGVLGSSTGSVPSPCLPTDSRLSSGFVGPDGSQRRDFLALFSGNWFRAVHRFWESLFPSGRFAVPGFSGSLLPPELNQSSSFHGAFPFSMSRHSSLVGALNEPFGLLSPPSS